MDRANKFPGIVEIDAVEMLFDSDDLSGDSTTCEDAVFFPTDVTGGGDFSQQGSCGIRHLRKESRAGSRAGLPVGCWWEIAEGLVRSFRVVDVGLPAVDIVGEVLEAVAADVRPEFAFESSMKSFDLALGLGMVGSAVDGFDAKSDESSVEPTDGFGNLKSGAEGIVGEDGGGHSVLAKSLPERVKRSGHGEIEAGLERDEESGVIVEDSQGMDFLPSDFERSFEVALPEVVWQRPFETDRIVRGFVGVVDGAVATKNVGDGSSAREILGLERAEMSMEFSRPPPEGLPSIEDEFFDVGGGLFRRDVRPTGLVVEMKWAVGGLFEASALHPLIGGLSTDAEIASHGRDRTPSREDDMNESGTKIRHV